MFIKANKSILIFSTCILFNLLLYLKFGVKMGGDSELYIHGADYLLSNTPFENKEGSYLGYLIVVAFFKFTGLGLKGIVLFQILIASLTSVVINIIGEKIANPMVGVLAACYYIFNIDIARWNFFIHTDALYTSFLVFSIAGIWQFTQEKSVSIKALLILLILFAIIMRPNGWTLILIISIFALNQWSFSQKKWNKLMIFGVLGCIILSFSIFIKPLQKGIAFESPQYHLMRGTVIWGYEDKWALAMPQESLDLDGDWMDAKTFIIKHPIACIKLFLLRILTELAHIRPFYSTFHNILIAFLELPLYPFAMLGFYRLKNNQLMHIILITIVLHLMVIGLTFANWDGRFLVYILPLISIIAFAEIVHRSRFLISDIQFFKKNLKS
jgi:hypothetical protein